MKDTIDESIHNIGNELFHILIQEFLGMGIDNHVQMNNENRLPKNPREEIMNPNLKRTNNRFTGSSIENVDLYEDSRLSRAAMYDQLEYLKDNNKNEFKPNPTNRPPFETDHVDFEPASLLELFLDKNSPYSILNQNFNNSRPSPMKPKDEARGSDFDETSNLNQSPTSLLDIFLNKESPYSILDQVEPSSNFSNNISNQVKPISTPAFYPSNPLTSWFTSYLPFSTDKSSPISSSWTTTSYTQVIQPDGTIEEKIVVKNVDGTQHVQHTTIKPHDQPPTHQVLNPKTSETSPKNSNPTKDLVKYEGIFNANFLQLDPKVWSEWSQNIWNQTYKSFWDTVFKS